MNALKLLIVLTGFYSMLSIAAIEPKTGRKDPRIKSVVYNESDVVELNTHFFRYTMVEFADHETFEYYFIGDPLAWQVEPKGNRVFIKPTDINPDTNLTIKTDKRIYLFRLKGGEKKGSDLDGDIATYALRFEYPDEKILALSRKEEAIAQLENQTVIPGHTIDPEKLNHNYAYKGKANFKPVQVFDDGVFTYFQFDKIGEVPSIFFVDDIVGGANKEQLINYHHRGNYIVIERIGSQFALRIDGELICVYNKNLYKNKKKLKTINK